jgi:hypothetical protein
MRILIIGSTSNGTLNVPAITKAAQQTAKALAAQGHTLVLLADREDTLAEPAAKGTVEGTTRPGALERLLPHNVPPAAAALAPSPQVRLRRHGPQTDAMAIHMNSLSRCEGIVVLGGGAGTHTVGLAGTLMNKAVIPIATFGGGAAVVYKYATSHRATFFRGVLSDDEIDALQTEWNDQSDPAAVGRHLVAIRREIVRGLIPSSLMNWIAAVLFFLLLAWIACICAPESWRRFVDMGKPDIRYFSLPLVIAASLMTGVIGACINVLRSIRDGREVTKRSVSVDLVLGAAVGVVSSVLYLVGEIGITGTIQVSVAPDDFVRVALFVSIISVFTGLYLDAALQRLDSLRESVFSRVKVGDAAPPRSP